MNDTPNNSKPQGNDKVANFSTSPSDLSLKLKGVLQKLLASEAWKKDSLFLKKARERIVTLLEETEDLIESNNPQKPQADEDDKSKKDSPQPGTVKVYISLYHVSPQQSESANLQSWLHTIKTLGLYNVTRPTYRLENHVRDMIESKADKQRHGYVEVMIHESDIIPIEPTPVDSLGYEMLILKEGSVHLQNILSFVHANKNRYKVQGNNLIFVGE